MVMGIAVPMSEGELTGVAELRWQREPQSSFASMIRFLFISSGRRHRGHAHYQRRIALRVRDLQYNLAASSLGAVGYRLTQTP